MIAGAATRTALREAGDRILVWDGEQSWTGAQLNQAVNTYAHRLRSAAGDGLVGLWAWNSADLIVAHLAAERAGLPRIAIDPEAPPAEAAAIAAAAGVAVVVVDTAHAPLAGIPAIVAGEDVTEQAPFPEREVAPDDVAVHIVRGFAGEQGSLLTIPLSIGNWEAHMELATALFIEGTYGEALAGEPCFLTVQQLQYGTGLVGTFPFLRMGLPQVILRRFDADAVADVAARHRLTATFMVPGMVSRLAAVYAQRRVGEDSLRFLYGGAPFRAEDLATCLEVFGSRMIQLYGRFEGGWPITVLGEDDHRRIADGDRRIAGSCGRVVNGVDIELRALPDGAGDELRVRSDCVAPSFRDPDGWCGLGDLAAQDGEGYVFLNGRADGMINTGSFHVYPGEVEAAITAEFPELHSVSVAARPDPKWGQAVAAELTWPAGATPPDREEFRGRMAHRLAKYKVPTYLDHHHLV